MLWRALMSGDIRSAFITLALSLPAIVLCLSIHETAHGGAAYLLGDRTARDSGRVTLSPMAHIDPIGFLCLLLFGFGWARPVPVNIANFQEQTLGHGADCALPVRYPTLSPPLSRTACIFVVRMNMTNTFLWSLSQFLLIVASMSVGLGVFNLVPVHPLDGSRVVDAFLPFSWSLKLQKYQNIIFFVFIVALWFGWLDGIMDWVGNGVLMLAVNFVSLFL